MHHQTAGTFFLEEFEFQLSGSNSKMLQFKQSLFQEEKKFVSENLIMGGK